MNMIFWKGEVPRDFRKTLIKPLYKKGDKSERDIWGNNYWDAVDKVIREEQCGFRKGRGCVN